MTEPLKHSMEGKCCLITGATSGIGYIATVTVNALHPGFVATNVGGNNGWPMKIIAPLAKLFALSPEKGAIASTYPALSPEVAGVTGKYFVNKQAVASSPRSYDDDSTAALGHHRSNHRSGVNI